MVGFHHGQECSPICKAGLPLQLTENNHQFVKVVEFNFTCARTNVEEKYHGIRPGLDPSPATKEYLNQWICRCQQYSIRMKMLFPNSICFYKYWHITIWMRWDYWLVPNTSLRVNPSRIFCTYPRCSSRGSNDGPYAILVDQSGLMCLFSFQILPEESKTSSHMSSKAHR